MSCIKVFTRVLAGAGRWEGSGGWRPWRLEGLKKLVGEGWTGDPGVLGREAGGDSSSDCELSCSSSSSPSLEVEEEEEDEADADSDADSFSDCKLSYVSSSPPSSEEEEEEALLPGALFQHVDGIIAADPQERPIQVGVVGAVLGVFSHRQINLQALLPQSLGRLLQLRGEAREGEGLV